ncbi:MAG: heavy metal sensor histidine kinase [Gammaproteobacteria bacterium]
MHFKTWSLTRRLAVFYACSTFIMLLATSLFLYGILIHRVVSDWEHFLKNEIKLITRIMQTNPQFDAALKQEIVWEPSTSDYHYYARLLDSKKQVVLQTHNMQALLADEIFPAANHDTLDRSNMITYRASDKQFYRLISSWIQPNPDQPAYLLQVALRVTHQQRVLIKYRNYLIAVLIIGLALSVTLGRWVARKGLMPLTRITHDITAITADNLATRLDVIALPSELAQLASNFNAVLQRLEQAFTRITQFAGDLAHELRTPINNLMGEAEISLARVRTKAEYQQILQSSLEELQRINQIVDGMLFLTRADQQKVQLRKQPIQLAEHVQHVMQYYATLAEEKAIMLSCSGDARVEVDPVLLQRALSNLLANALYYTPKHGNVKILITLNHPTQDKVLIHVKDTGIGIAPEQLEHIFERFYRADYARSREHGAQGTGLGLAIVKSIAEVHQGDVYVTSTLGQGSDFVLVLPCSQQI